MYAKLNEVKIECFFFVTTFYHTTRNAFKFQSFPIQISCLSASAALSDRDKFKYYFQLLNSYDTQAYASYGVIKEYGWKYVSMIVQDENLFTNVGKVAMDTE